MFQGQLHWKWFCLSSIFSFYWQALPVKQSFPFPTVIAVTFCAFVWDVRCLLAQYYWASSPIRALVPASNLRRDLRRLLHRVGVKLNGPVRPLLQARDHAPARLVGRGLVKPEMRAAAFHARQGRGRQQAAEQGEISHRKRALELGAAHLGGAARLVIEPHAGHVLALDALVFRKRLAQRALVPDRPQLVVRQHAAAHAHVRLQQATVAPDETGKPFPFAFRNCIDLRLLRSSALLPDQRRGLPPRAPAIDQRSRK